MFEAVGSPVRLAQAQQLIRSAITSTSKKIREAIEKVAGDEPVSHRAFMIYPSNERRSLVMCLVKPVSEWALDVILSVLESEGAEAAYKLYRSIGEYPPVSAFRGQLWERKVQQYFDSGNLPSFTIRSLDDSSTMEWNPFKNMLKFIFRPSNRIVGYLQDCIKAKKAGYFRPKSNIFESFDSIIYEPEKPLVIIQITENYTHPIKACGPIFLQDLLGPSNAAFLPSRLKALDDTFRRSHTNAKELPETRVQTE